MGQGPYGDGRSGRCHAIGEEVGPGAVPGVEVVHVDEERRDVDQVGPVEAPGPATRASVTAWVPADQDAHVPTRAPPLS